MAKGVSVRTENRMRNLRYLRRYLGLTQAAFISRFLTNEGDETMLSVATLSNLEKKGGVRLTEVIRRAADALQLDPELFTLPSDQFAEKLESHLPESDREAAGTRIQKKRNEGSELVNRLSVYFSEQLLQNRLQIGDKIESDRALAEKMGVSREALREAMHVMAYLGMLDIRPGQGTYISGGDMSFFIIPMSWSFFLSEAQTDNVLVVRGQLEIKAAALAARCQNGALFARLQDIMHRSQVACMKRNLKAMQECDIEFHLCVAECSQNQVILSIIRTIRNLTKIISGREMENEEQMRDSLEEHREVYEKILAQDVKGAEEAMRRHMKDSRARYEKNGYGSGAPFF